MPTTTGTRSYPRLLYHPGTQIHPAKSALAYPLAHREKNRILIARHRGIELSGNRRRFENSRRHGQIAYQPRTHRAGENFTEDEGRNYLALDGIRLRARGEINFRFQNSRVERSEI